MLAGVHGLSMAERFATHAIVSAGQGAWLTGAANQVPNEPPLSLAFGHPLRRLSRGGDVALVAC